jgi:hypothetical protein
MFDTNANDAAALDQSYRDLLIWAQDKKEIELITTHIQIDQIDAIRDRDKKQIVYCINVSADTTETYGFIPGLSRKGWALEGKFEEFLGNKEHNYRNLSDALIAATAKKKVDILVTDDESLIKKTRGKVKTLKSKEFKNYLENLKFKQEKLQKILRPNHVGEKTKNRQNSP